MRPNCGVPSEKIGRNDYGKRYANGKTRRRYVIMSENQGKEKQGKIRISSENMMPIIKNGCIRIKIYFFAKSWRTA